MSKKQFLDSVLAEIRELCKLTCREQVSSTAMRAAVKIAKANAADWNETAIPVSEAADLALELARV